MLNLQYWIIAIEIVFSSGGVMSGSDEREHVHIKVHIPEVHQKHTHLRKVQKHYFHPKKIVSHPEIIDSSLEATPLSLLSYGSPYSDHGHDLHFSSYPVGIPNFPDMPTYGLDNTLEASVLRKRKIPGISQFMSEGLFSKFHGMKKPSEFIGAHPANDPMEEDDEEAYADDYDARSTEAVVIDQRVAGSSYPYSMAMGDSYKSKWPSYANVFESSMKPMSNRMKWLDWLSGTTESEYSMFDRFPSQTTMHIPKAKPLPSSRLKYEQHSFDRDPYSEPWVVPKKKKSKTEKRSRKPSPGFRINY